MNDGQLLLVCDEEDSLAAQTLAEAVLSRWPAGGKPHLRQAAPDDLNELKDAHTDAVWLYADKNLDRARLYQRLDDLDEHRIPTLLTRAEEQSPAGSSFREGVVIGPPDADPQQLQLLLATLICQGRLVRALKQEMAILSRHQRGLMGQIGQLDEELRLAARTQRQFLPQELPQLPGVNCDILFRPAGYVSGDIYDVQRLDENHLGFYIADAVGHGVPAALLTMFIKQSLQTREVRGNDYRITPPDEVLDRLNRDLLNRRGTTTQFVTACYGTLNCASGELQLARAGHPPPILLRGGGEVQLLEPEGPLLGVFEDEPFECSVLQVEPGDRLLIYSDGFELAFGDNNKPCNPSYVSELHNLRDGSLDTALRRLEGRLDQQVGSLHQRDDMTALMLEIAQPAAWENAKPEAEALTSRA